MIDVGGRGDPPLRAQKARPDNPPPPRCGLLPVVVRRLAADRTTREFLRVPAAPSSDVDFRREIRVQERASGARRPVADRCLKSCLDRGDKGEGVGWVDEIGGGGYRCSDCARRSPVVRAQALSRYPR